MPDLNEKLQYRINWVNNVDLKNSQKVSQYVERIIMHLKNNEFKYMPSN